MDDDGFKMFQDVSRFSKMFQDVSRNPGKQESTQFCPVSIWSTVVDVEDVLDVEVDDVLDEVVEEEDTVDEVLHSYFINSKQDL